MSTTRARAVRFERYGGVEVLSVVDIAVPVPAVGEVVVAVRAAGINPGEVLIRSGAVRERFPATFPTGQGSDLAGVVTALGPDGSRGDGPFAVGDEVLGYSWTRSSHATHTAVPLAQLVAKPPQLGWEVAGALFVAGSTALAAVRAVDPQPGEVVAVSAAAGGVGVFVVQLLVRRGVRVLGIASEANAAWLSSHGAVPIAHGDGLRQRLLDAAGPGGVSAFVDLFGPEHLDLAVDLGVPVERMETVISFARAAELGARTAGTADAATRQDLAQLADSTATGAVEVPIAATYPLERVAEAFTDLERRRTRGKIVLIP